MLSVTVIRGASMVLVNAGKDWNISFNPYARFKSKKAAIIYIKAICDGETEIIEYLEKIAEIRDGGADFIRWPTDMGPIEEMVHHDPCIPYFAEDSGRWTTNTGEPLPQ